jgi:hypothetical protein
MVEFGEVNGHKGLAVVRALPGQPQPPCQGSSGFRRGTETLGECGIGKHFDWHDGSPLPGWNAGLIVIGALDLPSPRMGPARRPVLAGFHFSGLFWNP